MYNTYTINGEQYFATSGALYRLTDETHTVDELKEEQPYFFDESIVVFDKTFTTLKAVKIHGSHECYPDQDSLTATVVSRVIPDGIDECPECGGWLGPTDADTNFCHKCDYEPQTQ